MTLLLSEVEQKYVSPCQDYRFLSSGHPQSQGNDKISLYIVKLLKITINNSIEQDDN